MFWKYKLKEKSPWEKYFAWEPKPIGSYPLKDGQEMAWLCFIERKFIDSRNGYYAYEYRKIRKKCKECIEGEKSGLKKNNCSVITCKNHKEWE